MAQAVSRIEREFIMKEFVENELSFELNHGQLQYAAKFKGFNEKQLHVDIDSTSSQLPDAEDNVDIFLRFRGQIMTFRTQVLERSNGSLTLAPPRSMYRDLTRAFRRVIAPSGVSIEFQLNEKVITLNYPDSERHELPQAPKVNLGFDASKIANLLASFRSKAAEYSSENKVIMFRSRTPDSLPEKLICDTGRMLVVPSPKNLGELVSDNTRDRTLLETDLQRLESESPSIYGDVRRQLTDYAGTLNGKSLLYELYCPLLFHQYVVGYLYLMQGKSGKALSKEVIEYVNEFAKVLVYSLNLNGYFEIREELPAYQDSELVDMSATGALFTQAAAGTPITLYSQLQLKIKFESRVLETRARVMRKFKDRERVYLGVRFTGLADPDFQELHKRLYGTPYEADTFNTGSDENDRQQGY
ncbi:MAG: PilZ domain-containing protein [Spirochaetaceae bacterium]|nr:MAG: PilZ domain-containing protein [Spirochaetaceae bacterium]